MNRSKTFAIYIGISENILNLAGCRKIVRCEEIGNHSTDDFIPVKGMERLPDCSPEILK